MGNKPVVSTNIDGNIFSVLAEASRAMREAGISAKTQEEMRERVFKADGYGTGLQIIMDYVDFGSPEAEEDEDTKPCYHCGEEFPVSELRDDTV